MKTELEDGAPRRHRSTACLPEKRNRASRGVQEEMSGFLEGKRNGLRCQPLRFLQSHGVDVPRRANACILDSDSFVFVSGRQVVVHRFLSGKRRAKKDSRAASGTDAPLPNERLDNAATLPAGPLRRKTIFLDALDPEETQATHGIDCIPATRADATEKQQPLDRSAERNLPAEAEIQALSPEAAVASSLDRNSFVLHYASGKDGEGGVSALAVDPFHKLLAVCEWNDSAQPSIHIYSTQTYKYLRSLRGESSTGYTCAAFRGCECFQSAPVDVHSTEQS
ncbi:WD domain, G-beta repeat-containing protein, partial [Toxoplasma gondii RUB]